MKVIWEPSDIKPGLVVGKSKRSERWMICYDPAIPWCDDPEFAPKWALVSLEDGMLARIGFTKTKMADHLNTAGEIPAVLLHE